MADCRAEVDQEIEGGHYDDTAEDRIHGQAQWLILTDTIQNIDNSLDLLEDTLKSQNSTVVSKVHEIKLRTRRNIEKRFDELRKQWSVKVRDIRDLRESAKTFTDEKLRLKNENRYLEKLVTRLQDQFTEAVDSSLAEIQELTILNSDLTRKIESLEMKFDIGEKNVLKIVQGCVDGLRRIVDKTSADVTIKEIGTLCSEEIRKLEIQGSLSDIFQLDVDYSSNIEEIKKREHTEKLNECRIRGLLTEVNDNHHVISQLKHHIHHLEQEKEAFMVRVLAAEDSEEDRQILDHTFSAISSTLESPDYSDVLDLTGIRKQVLGIKRSSSKLRGSLADVYKSVLMKEDELCDLRDNIDEIKLKWTNSTTKMGTMEEENEFLRRKLEQEDQKSKISSDEIISLQHRIQMIENEKKALKDQMFDLRNGKEELKAFYNNLNLENEKYLQEISRLQSERHSMLGQLHDTTKKASETAQESLDIEERHHNLEKSFSKLKREFQEQNRELSSVTRENDDLKLILQEQQGEKDKYKNEFRNIDIVNKDLDDQVFQLSKDNERLMNEIEKVRKTKQSLESELHDAKQSLAKKEAVKEQSEQKIKDINRSFKETTQNYETSKSELKRKSDELTKESAKVSDLDLYLRQFFRQRRELVSLVCQDKDDERLQKLKSLAATNFELEDDSIVVECKESIPSVVESTYELLLQYLKTMSQNRQEQDEENVRVLNVLTRFLQRVETNECSSTDGVLSMNTMFGDNHRNKTFSNITKLINYCERLEEEITSLKRAPSSFEEDNAQNNFLKQLATKTSMNLSLKEQKERTLMLKLKNRKNVETALRNKISRLRKEVKEIKAKSQLARGPPRISSTEEIASKPHKQSIEELTEWSEFMKGIVDEFSFVKDKTEQCMANDVLSDQGPESNEEDSYLKTKTKEISLQIQTLLRNTKEALFQKEMEIEEQLAGKKALQKLLVQNEGYKEDLNKEQQSDADKNGKVKNFNDMILRYTVAATRQLEVILDNLSGKECVIMFQRKTQLVYQNSEEKHSTEDLKSFVRSSMQANEKTLQVLIATLDMVKEKGVCDLISDEELQIVDSEQRDILKLLRRINQSVDKLTKRLRTLMIGAEFVRAGSLNSISLVESESTHLDDNRVGSTFDVSELEDAVSQKEELLKILENELDQLRLEKSRLLTDIHDKDVDLEILRSDVHRLTLLSDGLESQLSEIKAEYHANSCLLAEKEDEVMRLNDLLKQHEEGTLSEGFDLEEASSTLESKREEIKILRRNVEDVRHVHIVNEERIRSLQNKIEQVTKFISDQKKEPDTGLASMSKNLNGKEQISFVKKSEVQAPKEKYCDVESGNVSYELGSLGENWNSDTGLEKADFMLKRKLKHKEKENVYLNSVVYDLKMELLKVQSNLKAMNDAKCTMLSKVDPNKRIYRTRHSLDGTTPCRRNVVKKSSVCLPLKDADDSSDAATVRSTGSSSLFRYRYPLHSRPLSDLTVFNKNFDPIDCELCSQTSESQDIMYSDDECDCPCSECDGSDASQTSDNEIRRQVPLREYRHNINCSKEARKVSLREATQAIRARNRKVTPERVRTAHSRSLSPNMQASLSRTSYDSEAVSCSDHSSPNFRHPRKAICSPKYSNPKHEMVPPPSTYDTSANSLNNMPMYSRSQSLRSQISSDDSQGESKHVSGGSGHPCTSPLDCRGHDCKKRRRKTFSLHVASATREKSNKIM